MSKYTIQMIEVFANLAEKVEQVGQEAATVFETDNLAMIHMRIEDTLEELVQLEYSLSAAKEIGQRLKSD